MIFESSQSFQLDYQPSPLLTPDQVVRIQLEMLQNNDLVPNDQGIRVAFRFASPANRAQVGPLEHFIPLLKQGPYANMIGFHRAELGRPLVVDGVARQRVALYTNHRRLSSSAQYLFILSLQTEAPYEGCWMTDSVLSA
jgi:hypothetical protein